MNHETSRPSDRDRSLNLATSDEMLAVVYEELRRLATSRLSREAPGHTLQPTALVHEAYLRLIGEDVRWDGRGHFFSAAAESMRRILVEHARRRNALKRGGNHAQIDSEPDDLAGTEIIPEVSSAQILAVDSALVRMEERDPRMAEVVRLRFFAGLSIEQTAAAMGVSDRTVRREWTFAKAWLSHQFSEDDADAD